MASPDTDAARVLVRQLEPGEGLSAEDDAWLKRGLAQAMPDLRLDELFRVRPRLFADLEFLVVAEDAATHQALAALGSRWAFTGAGERFLHISVQFVAQSRRGGRLFVGTWQEHLTAVLASGFFPRLSALKTYNPVAYCAMRAYGRLPGAHMYPELDGRDTNAALAAKARDMARTLAPDHEFDARHGVIRGVGVPRDLYRERPRCDDEAVDAYFAEHVRPGDRLLAVVEVGGSQTEAAVKERFGLAGS